MLTISYGLCLDQDEYTDSKRARPSSTLGLLDMANAASNANSFQTRTQQDLINDEDMDLESAIDNDRDKFGFYERDMFLAQNSSIKRNCLAHDKTFADLMQKGKKLYQQYIDADNDWEWEEQTKNLSQGFKRNMGQNYERKMASIKKRIDRKHTLPQFAMHMGTSHVLSYNGGDTARLERFYMRRYDPNQKHVMLETPKPDSYESKLPIRTLYALRAGVDTLIQYIETELTNKGKDPDVTQSILSANDLAGN